MTNVFGVFDTNNQAGTAIVALNRAGFTQDDISLLAQESMLRGDVSQTTPGAASGAMFGSIGGLIAGIAGITIPGIGPILGTGLFASLIGTTAVGASAGLIAGGVMGAITDLGASMESAKVYEDAIRNGGILIAVRASDNQIQEATDILINTGGKQVHSYHPARAFSRS